MGEWEVRRWVNEMDAMALISNSGAWRWQPVGGHGVRDEAALSVCPCTVYRALDVMWWLTADAPATSCQRYRGRHVMGGRGVVWWLTVMRPKLVLSKHEPVSL